MTEKLESPSISVGIPGTLGEFADGFAEAFSEMETGL